MDKTAKHFGQILVLYTGLFRQSLPPDRLRTLQLPAFLDTTLGAQTERFVLPDLKENICTLFFMLVQGVEKKYKFSLR